MKGTTLKKGPLAYWEPGKEVLVSFHLSVNHGGGYRYSLCPKPKGYRGNLDLEETCFEALDFVGNVSWIAANGKDPSGAEQHNRTEIPALRTTEGTTPRGSMWTRNPIPNCVGGPHAIPPGGRQKLLPCETAFDPLLPGLMGNFGGDFYDGDKVHLIPDVSIVDLVQVPPNLRGDFVLQFRYDCVSTWFQPDRPFFFICVCFRIYDGVLSQEQTSQVWTTCADVRIV